MMRNFAAAFLLLFAIHASAQSDPIKVATDLVDAGKIDEGIAALKKIVGDDPSNARATYELGLAYATKGDNQQCIATLQLVAEKTSDVQVPAITNLASCLDATGQRDKAVEMYKRGLKIAPGNPSLTYNLAVTYAEQNKLTESRALLKQETEANPSHASGQLLLAHIFSAQGYAVPALFAYLRFLALEPASSRSPQAIAAVGKLLSRGVEKNGEKQTNITIDPNAPKDEGDYMPVSLTVAMTTAARDTEEKKKLSEFEKLQDQIATVIAVFGELADNKHTDYTDRVQRPFFAAMEKEKLVEPFVAAAFATAKIAGSREWTEKHTGEIDRYLKWITPQLQHKPVMLPPPK